MLRAVTHRSERVDKGRQAAACARPGVAFLRSAQYFGADVDAGAAPPDALHDDFPLPAGAALEPPALQELLPPAADGSVAAGAAALPPPHATTEPINIPENADTAKAFAMFIASVSPLLLEKRP